MLYPYLVTPARALEPIEPTEAATPGKHVEALYLHVPFCPSICPYCDFHKMLRNEGLVARYLERLELEAEALAARYPGALRTVYLGGGTPSHLSDAELTRALNAVKRGWGGLGSVETTLEADPLTFDEERLELFKQLGVTRLSIGLQATQDHTLKFLGRVHDGAQGLAAVRMALDSGLRTNVDIIMAVDGQDLELDLRTVLDLGANHLSVYSLTIEANTPFGRRGVRVDPDKDADDFELAGAVIAEYGLKRYEVSNFARPGEESHHNLAYWRGDHYLALGPSASGYLPEGPFGTRYRNGPIKAWLLGAAPELELLNADDVVLERLMTGLRSSEGVDLRELQRRSGQELEVVALDWLREGLHHDLLELDDDRVLRATAVGLERLDALLRSFLASQAPIS